MNPLKCFIRNSVPAGCCRKIGSRLLKNSPVDQTAPHILKIPKRCLTSRLPDLALEEMNARQREVYFSIKAGPRKVVEGPLLVWLHSPDLAQRAQALGEFCRYSTSLEPRLSELVILTTGLGRLLQSRIWGSHYEWLVHKPEALKAGLDPEIIEAIRDGREPVFQKEDEKLVYEFASQVHNGKAVSDEIYAKAVEVLGQRQVVDLVGVIGYYSLISMTINVFNVPPPKGVKPDF
mmetsp:Transcript_8268/g.12631  ORF Transcript_8268/g.12631 Transcript_8268/m.12631 type:complete len:234 (+) Transcript_8268:103-804(+)